MVREPIAKTGMELIFGTKQGPEVEGGANSDLFNGHDQGQKHGHDQGQTNRSAIRDYNRKRQFKERKWRNEACGAHHQPFRLSLAAEWETKLIDLITLDVCPTVAALSSKAAQKKSSTSGKRKIDEADTTDFCFT
jgi:hypothetical protein